MFCFSFYIELVPLGNRSGEALDIEGLGTLVVLGHVALQRGILVDDSFDALMRVPCHPFEQILVC